MCAPPRPQSQVKLSAHRTTAATLDKWLTSMLSSAGGGVAPILMMGRSDGTRLIREGPEWRRSCSFVVGEGSEGKDHIRPGAGESVRATLDRFRLTAVSARKSSSATYNGADCCQLQAGLCAYSSGGA